MSACKHTGRDSPRILVGRHGPECPASVNRIDPIRPNGVGPVLGDTETLEGSQNGAQCLGCLPCTQPHCGTCGSRHVDELTCPECVGNVREDISEIVAMNPRMPPEARHRGVNSQAMMLAGPASDNRAAEERRLCKCRPFWTCPDLADRIGPACQKKCKHESCRWLTGYLRRCPAHAAWDADNRDEPHALWVLGTWDMLITEHYGHERTQRVTVESAAAYLTANLSDLAQDPDFAFEELASEVKQCRAHMESVLHDQARGDVANIGCFDCGDRLERRLGEHGFEDHWTCRGCRRRYTYAEYNFALRASLESAQEEAS